MRWLIPGCLLGALGALFRYWQLPLAIWLNIAGLSVLVVGFFSWFRAFGRGALRRNRHARAGDAGSFDSGADFGFDSGGGAACDAGGGGDCGGD